MGIGIAIGYVGCGSDNNGATVSTAYESPYLYTSTYPADVAYSSMYWANDWGYPTLYLDAPAQYGAPAPAAPSTGVGGAMAAMGMGGATGAAGATGAGGATSANTGAPRFASAADLIRALARGDTTICPGQVTVTPKTGPSACTAGVSAGAQVRAGVTIVFNGCQIPDAGTVSGTVDVASTRTASPPECGAGATITLSHTTTITNLVYTAPGGSRVAIPSQTDTGTNTFTFGQTPPTVKISSTGQLQIYGPDGTLTSDKNHQGERTFSFAGSTTSYNVDGTVNVTDNQLSGVSAAMTLTGLTRVSTCCRPTGGTLQIVRTGGTFPGTHTWTFSPTCGSAMVDGKSVTLPDCIF
jgi:hypothetical protein